MSFGAGALLAALTLVLVHKSLKIAGFPPLGAGCITGALLFMLLNRMLDGQGGFLRKISTTVGYLKTFKRKHAETILDELAAVKILRELPPEEMHAIVPLLQSVSFPAGQEIFGRGDAGDRLYLIEDGEAEVAGGDRAMNSEIACLGPGDTFGEMALIHDEPRTAAVRAKTALRTWALDKSDFARILKRSPELAKAVKALDASRRDELDRISKELEEKASQSWANRAKAHLNSSETSPSQHDIKEASSQHGGAAFAIWLGILLDGIPESLVIGGSMTSTGAVSMSLIVGVFLANFPEALSSGVGMKKQGYSTSKIIWMWTSLTIMTGAGAFIGNLIFGYISHAVFAFIEGIAAGAMLAMIAETMLPEAAEQGGPANGLMTVLGFLAAIFVETLGTGH